MENGGVTFNLAQSVHHHSLLLPQAIAVAAEGRSLSYGELAGRAAALAAQLQKSPAWHTADGTPPRVGILASRSADACVAVLGAMWAGATYVPLGLKLPQERLLTILSLCNLAAIVADEEGARLLNKEVLQAAPPLVCILKPEQEGCPTGAQQRPAPMQASDTAYIIFTSGTTGVPKGVMISAGAARHYIRTMTALLALQPCDRILETFELTFDVSVQNMFCTWEAGASLHVLPAARVMNAVRFARDSSLTVWLSVPSLVAMLRQVKALGPGVLPALRMTVFGGEQLPKGVVDTWRAAAPASAIYNHYGPTEVTVCSLVQLIDEPIPLMPGRDVVGIGTALPGTEAAVLDADGNPVADHCTGELALAGVQLATGYLDAPELTAARFPTLQGKRWYLTGDLAMRDGSGIFHCIGRMDNQIKVLGHRVELEEIDSHLRIVADADMAGTVAWPSVDGAAQGLIAFVCARIIDEAQTIHALKARLPHYMIPSRIIPLETMPLNANGKVDRKALKLLLETRVHDVRSRPD
ncbi:amino acid adenylation domain-containing protein [Janthinobacterium sp. 17J80-10]|uniref:amino acid adenylation domain-containing protein n=1 Tax=Janthinobacterium sp. 17J80-10 TaxID=2497863 RepID=UPI0010056FC6|nr:amino acid adenylation domain-containing protein [Janthinobacterium sp. 17J80-10]QAU33708.1 amino acid adenylation domain-containing protein [Janthinobacterium sp. 17J80-10]